VTARWLRLDQLPVSAHRRRCILENAEVICRVSARDSGKTLVDAGFGEVLVTLEKIQWLCSEGETHLRPERRSAGRVCFYKSARVEWHPRGVMGAIVPWNYPFHNILNPLTAALFAGNAIVIKVSEHASWSSLFYLRLIHACLAAAGAPTDLVQLVFGYGATGAALVSAVDKMIFVGSCTVGRLVMAQAAKTLTPVTLELGGKDPLVLLPGTDLNAVVPTALRAGFGASGQNCMGAERFFVHASLLSAFSAALTDVAKQMRQGPPLNSAANTGIDIGSLCLPGEAKRIDSIIQEAASNGAEVLVGGALPDPEVFGGGQFYPPTILLIPAALKIASKKWRLLTEEIFGPVITIIPFETDEELIEMANDCPFALGSNIFGSPIHIRRLGAHVQAGMLACNDFATCYMCQSLPMGGLKESGFGKFAGIEGLRDCCVAKAVVEDGLPFVRTVVPPPLRYPLPDNAFPFIRGLITFFYGHSLQAKALGVVRLLGALLQPTKSKSN